MKSKTTLIISGMLTSAKQITAGLLVLMGIATVVSPLLFLWIQVEKWLWNLIAGIF